MVVVVVIALEDGARRGGRVPSVRRHRAWCSPTVARVPRAVSFTLRAHPRHTPVARHHARRAAGEFPGRALAKLAPMVAMLKV